MSSGGSGLPFGWRSKVDPRSGRTYYVCDATKVTQWKRPAEPRAQVSVGVAKSGSNYVFVATAVAPKKRSCPFGHEVKQFTTPTNTFFCSKCYQPKKLGTVVYACRPCDFDLCATCLPKEDTNQDIIKMAETIVAASVLRGVFDKFKNFIQKEKAFANSRERSGLYRAENPTVLMLAVLKEDMDVVKFLIQNGANTNLVDNTGDTALFLAVRKQNSLCVKLLLDNGADANIQNQTESTALIDAARRDDLSILTMLVDRGADVHKVNKDGETALQVATNFSKQQNIMLLIARGSDVNFWDKDGYTGLIRAVRKSNKVFVELWLKSGANVNKADKEGKLPVNHACDKENYPLFKMLFTRMDKTLAAKLVDSDKCTIRLRQYIAWIAIEDGHSRAESQALLKTSVGLPHHKEVLQTKDTEGRTLLIVASDKGHFGIVSLLIRMLERSGLSHSVNSPDKSGCTALMSAAMYGHISVMKLLERVNPRADADKQNHDGDTALMLASRNGHKAAVTMLLSEYKASVNSRNKKGKSALMLAAENGHAPVVSILLRHHAQFRSEGDMGYTPLMAAAQNSHNEVITAILDRLGFDAVDNFTDKKGRKATSVEIVAKNCQKFLHLEIARVKEPVSMPFASAPPAERVESFASAPPAERVELWSGVSYRRDSEEKQQASSAPKEKNAEAIVTEVSTMLSALELTQYAHCLHDAGFERMRELAEITRSDMRELGIKFGHAIRIEKHMKDIQSLRDDDKQLLKVVPDFEEPDQEENAALDVLHLPPPAYAD